VHAASGRRFASRFVGDVTTRRMVSFPLGKVSPVHTIMVRFPDGTCAKVVAGEVRDVWIAGELPASPRMRELPPHA